MPANRLGALLVVCLILPGLASCGQGTPKPKSKPLEISATMTLEKIYGTSEDQDLTFAGKTELAFTDNAAAAVTLGGISKSYEFFQEGSNVTTDAQFTGVAEGFPCILKSGETKVFAWKSGGKIHRNRKYAMTFTVQIDGREEKVSVPIAIVEKPGDPSPAR